MTESALSPVVLAAGYVLVSWYKPLLLLLTITPWAWVVSTIYDKDAARWYFKRRTWNFGHLAIAVVAVGIVLAVPLTFWITWPLLILLLAGDLGLYAFLRNNDERVPEAHRWSLEKILASREKKEKVEELKGIEMVFQGPGGRMPMPEPETPQYEIRVAVEQLMLRMLQARGSQFDVRPIQENVYGATCLVDGVAMPLEKLPAAKAVAIVDFFKLAAGLDVEDRRRKLTGDLQFAATTSGPMTPARITTMGTSSGIRMTLLVDPVGQVQRRAEDLGLFSTQKTVLDAIVADGTGVVLLVAPPDNGRTSTLYAMMRAHDAYTSNVQTIEVDQQASVEGVRHNVFDPQADGAEYATTVRSILRRDPDVVGIAELPDEETAKVITKADLEQTRVYVSLKADAALTGIQLWCRAVGDQATAANALRGVVAQKLLRKLCDNCKVPFQPTPEMLKKLHLPADVKQLYRKGGQVLVKDKPQTCSVCHGSGYYGQVAAFAVHDLGADERRLIAGNELSQLRAIFRQKKQPSIQTSAMQLVVTGDTSVDEVLRVMQGEQPKTKSGSREPAPAS